MTRYSKRYKQSGSRFANRFLSRDSRQGVGLFITGILGIAFVAYFLNGALIPMVLAWVFAYLLHPLILVLSTKVSKRVAVWTVYLLTILILGLIVFVVVPRLIFEAILFLQDLPVVLAATMAQLQSFILGLNIPGLHEIHLKTFFQRQLTTFSFGHATGISGIINNLGSQIVRVALSIANYALFPIFFYYFLSDFERLRPFFISLIPRIWKVPVTKVLEVTTHVMSNYIRGQLMVAGLLAVLYGIGLSLVGLKYGAVIGIATGLLNVIPYFGFAVGLVSGGLIALFSGQGIVHLLLVLMVFLVVQMLESFVLTPRIVGYQVGLNPVLAMISLIVGGNSLGLFGMLIAVPFAAILKVGYDTWIAKDGL